MLRTYYMYTKYTHYIILKQTHSQKSRPYSYCLQTKTSPNTAQGYRCSVLAHGSGLLSRNNNTLHQRFFDKWIDHPAHKKASLFTFDLNRRATVSPLFTKPPPAPDSLIKTTAWTTNSFVGAPQFSDRHSHLLAPPMSLFSIDRQNQNR